MARVLETVFTDFKPSPLQQAAIDRIQEYKKELKSYGMSVRSSIELEFMIQDSSGFLVPGVVNMTQAEKFLREKERLPMIEDMGLEGELPIRLNMPQMATQYEIRIADDARRDAPGKPIYASRLAPEDVAAVTERLKTRSLKKMLESSTCLNNDSIGRDNLHLLPTFAARPNADEPADSLKHNSETSAMHISVSLYDNAGNNLFGMSNRLLDHCAASMAKLQSEVGLAMLPSAESLKRLGANSSVASGIGVHIGKFFDGNQYTSVTTRGNRDGLYSEVARVENRLPGADADPFVSMAVTLAALVDAVHKNVEKKDDPEHRKINIKIKPFQRTKIPERLYRTPAPDVLEGYETNFKERSRLEVEAYHRDYGTYDIPTTHQDMVKKFSASESTSHVRELLGPKLYDLILQEYGRPGPAPAR